MDYKLSAKNEENKTKYERLIDENNKKIEILLKKKSSIELDENLGIYDRGLNALEIQIQIEEIKRDNSTKEQAIADLYVRQVNENLKQLKIDGKISDQEFANVAQNIRQYREMIDITNIINDYEAEEKILKMKLRFENMSKSMQRTPKELADNKISIIKKELSSNKENKNYEYENLSEEYSKFRERNLYYQKNNKEISKDDFNNQLESVRSNKRIPSKKELTEIIDVLKNRYLAKAEKAQESVAKKNNQIDEKPSQKSKQKLEPYKREISARSKLNYNNSKDKLGDIKGKLNMPHNITLYYSLIKNNEINLYDYTAGEEKFEDVVNRLSKCYSKDLDNKERKLARHFATLEVKGFDEFDDPYLDSRFVPGKGFKKVLKQLKKQIEKSADEGNNPKFLLQLEEVEGINLDEIHNPRNIDTSILGNNIYIATYEISVTDDDISEYYNTYMPIKEYYIEDNNKQLIKLGTGTIDETIFTISGANIKLPSEKVVSGKSLGTITQYELADKLIKDNIETTMKCGKVTEVAEITDHKFLEDFTKQCGISSKKEITPFIISTINEKGEEDFNIILRKRNHDQEKEKTNNNLNKSFRYESLQGIYATENKGRNIITTISNIFSEKNKENQETQTLKEFQTKSGHKYAITRNEKGELCLNEIYRITSKDIYGEAVSTYTYAISDLVKAYTDLEINNTDLRNAYGMLNRTRNNEQKKEKKEK